MKHWELCQSAWTPCVSEALYTPGYMNKVPVSMCTYFVPQRPCNHRQMKTGASRHVHVLCASEALSYLKTQGAKNLVTKVTAAQMICPKVCRVPSLRKNGKNSACQTGQRP